MTQTHITITPFTNQWETHQTRIWSHIPPNWIWIYGTPPHYYTTVGDLRLKRGGNDRLIWTHDDNLNYKYLR